jgi:hypothetical protein
VSLELSTTPAIIVIRMIVIKTEINHTDQLRAGAVVPVAAWDAFT